MRFATFDQWKSVGFHVLEGAKSYKRNKKGQAVFAENQVEEDYDWYEEMELWGMTEWDFQ